jgi:hypothetical protein
MRQVPRDCHAEEGKGGYGENGLTQSNRETEKRAESTLQRATDREAGHARHSPFVLRYSVPSV